MKFDAIYFERICKSNGQIHPFGGALTAFARNLEDGDQVAIVGCGKWPESPYILEEMCADKDITITGIDPALRHPRATSKISFIKKTFEDFLDVEQVPGLGIPQQAIYHAVKQEPRVIGMHCCGCESHAHSRNLTLGSIHPEQDDYIDDIRSFLGMCGYSVKEIPNNRYAFLAINLEQADSLHKRLGMPKEYYDYLKRRGYFD